MIQSKLYYSYPQVVLQEVPGELSLALSISGCKLACKGCHSSETWDSTYGTKLTTDTLLALLAKHKHITCVLFYGGEWEPNTLTHFLKLIKTHNLKTCLYTGQELQDIPQAIINNLTFIKTGPYKEALGGLGSPSTNQRFIAL